MDLSTIYLNNLKNEPEFIRLLELKEIINKKYSLLIMAMKTNEANYLEMKEYESYRPDVRDLKLKFQESKSKLYSMPEVKEYFELERSVQKMINNDLNELKGSISNKFILSKELKF